MPKIELSSVELSDVVAALEQASAEWREYAQPAGPMADVWIAQADRAQALRDRIAEETGY